MRDFSQRDSSPAAKFKRLHAEQMNCVRFGFDIRE